MSHVLWIIISNDIASVPSVVVLEQCLMVNLLFHNCRDSGKQGGFPEICAGSEKVEGEL